MKLPERLTRILDNWPAKILSLSAAILLFVYNHQNTLSERKINLTPEVLLPDDFTIAGQTNLDVFCQFKGDFPEDVSTNEEFKNKYILPNYRIFIDLSFVTKPDNYTVPVQIERTDFSEDFSFFLDKNDIKPNEKSIVVDLKSSKIVPVRFNYTGSPVRGYELSWLVHPDRVTVIGPASRLQSISYLETEPIDVTGKFSDFIINANIQHNELFRIKETEIVKVYGNIREKIIETTLKDVPIRIKDLTDELFLETELPLGEINLKAPQLTLEDFESLDINLILDLKTINKPGTYEARLYYNIPPGAVVLDYSPKSLVFTLQRSIREVP